MSERLLEAFREEAERHARMPAFESIEAAGRRRRLRRRAAAGVVTACLLGISGLLAATSGDRAEPQPVEDPDDVSLATPYPAGRMTTLAEGTYELDPSDSSLPAVRFTVPPGWNSWVGPNRFAGLSDGASGQVRSNEEVLEDGPEWLLGMLVLDVEWVARPGCTMTDLRGADTTTLVRALVEVPRLEVISRPERGVRFGHRVVHLRLREQGREGNCPNESYLNASPTAQVTYLGPGTTYDAWVIDLDGRPLLVWAAWTRDTPDDEVDDLLGIVDSVELVDGDSPQADRALPRG